MQTPTKKPDQKIKINSYKDLIVWQKSMDLVEDIYKLTARLPSSEKFGLSSQMRRAAVSVPSNIAEGYKRNNSGEYIQFCGVSAGSLAELETQLYVTSRVYPQVDVVALINKADEVQRMLYVMLKSLRVARTVH